MRNNLKKYCVIGYPIKHSLSPKIFNQWFKRMKIPARYFAEEVRPENLAKFIRVFREKYAGANVTIPHKEKTIKFLDKLSPEAKAIGAVNVIVNRRGKLIGYNTDCFGAMEALRQKISCRLSVISCQTGKFLRGKNVTVLGAGGAARAIVYGLKKAGAKVTVLSRTVSRAKKMAQGFGLASAGQQGFGLLEDFDPTNCDILINATSVGMWTEKVKSQKLKAKSAIKNSKVTLLPNFSAFFNSHPSPLTPHPLIVMDIIYRPRMTRFLRDAKTAGLQIITGDNMFLNQAAKTFEIWTGCKFPPE